MAQKRQREDEPEQALLKQQRVESREEVARQKCLLHLLESCAKFTVNHHDHDKHIKSFAEQIAVSTKSDELKRFWLWLSWLHEVD